MPIKTIMFAKFHYNFISLNDGLSANDYDKYDSLNFVRKKNFDCITELLNLNSFRCPLGIISTCEKLSFLNVVLICKTNSMHRREVTLDCAKDDIFHLERYKSGSP